MIFVVSGKRFFIPSRIFFFFSVSTALVESSRIRILGFLRSALETITIDSAPKGETDLGSAIRESLQVIAQIDGKDGEKADRSAIILISDGGDLRGDAIKEAEKELGDDGRVLVRVSGTEPLVRVMIEGKNEEKINTLAQEIAQVIKERLL